MKFTKMHGCGNDYIQFNCFTENIENPEALSIKLSDRHFGVGGDGIVMIMPSEVADFRMRMFNADGSEGNMCGNAIRCIGKFVYDKGLTDKTEITVETKSGIKHLTLHTENGAVKSVTVNMGNPGVMEVSAGLMAGNEHFKYTDVSMGNPHCVIFVDEPSDHLVHEVGPVIENLAIFPDRTNVEFVKVIDDKTLQMRVWERGSGETWACGTGASATVVAAVENGIAKKDEEVCVKLLGGDLYIKYTDDGVFMTGGAEFVFEGEII